MSKLHLWMSACIVLISLSANGQSMSKLEKNITPVEFLTEKSEFRQLQFQDYYLVKASFKQRLSTREQNRLQAMGVELLQGFGNNDYLVKIPANSSIDLFNDANINNIKIESPTTKLSAEINDQVVPDWADAGNGMVNITVAFLEVSTSAAIVDILNDVSATLLPANSKSLHIQQITIAQQHLMTLASHPLVHSIEYVQEADQVLMFENRSMQRVNQLQSNIPGELNLDGEGVCIGVGDGGELGQHLDFEGRVTNQANGTYSSFGSHADHVSGIIGGAGNINPWHHGMAPKSQVLTQKTSLITYYAPEYYTDFGMVLTNNSYGTSSTCDYNGEYNSTSAILDGQLSDYPEMLHIFAAGNSGGVSCEGYPSGYRTVLRFYQAAKNILTVGNIEEDRRINLNSSRGPAMDGRLKPEIVGVGTSVISTGGDYNYYSGSGTSMAAPSVTGTLGLLYELYRELNNDQNPTGALVKAVACNTAEDLGNPGPDYTFGYGLIDATRAARAIEEERFETGTLTAAGNTSYQIEVPAGAGQLKVMLYWSDVKGDPTMANALVNDLDLSVAMGGSNYLPWILDPTPANVANDAVRGVDHLNNIEQVTIDNPTAGTYDVAISAFDIPLGTQDFVMTYEIVEPEIELTFPMGGEILEPNKAVMIRWAAEYFNSSTFKVEWSANNGGSWTTIQDNIAADKRSLNWMVPATYTETALVRVIRTSNAQQDQSQTTFNIIASPTGLTAVGACSKTIDLNWNPVDGATTYQIFMFQNDAFEIVGTTDETTFKVLETMIMGTMYWFSVNAVMPSSQKSERAIAAAGIPDSMDPCDWNNDAVISLPTIVKGREKTSMALLDDQLLEMTVTNIGQNEITNFTINYSLNGLPELSEAFNVSLGSGETMEITFTEGLDLSGVGSYDIAADIEVPGDSNPGNNSIDATLIAEQISHPAITLPYEIKFETNNYSLSGYHFSIPDYQNVDINTGVGGKFELLKLGDAKVCNFARTSNWADGVTFSEGTFNLNLEDFHRSEDPLILSFRYLGHSSQVPNGIANGNKVLFRASDQDEWITIHEMSYDKNWREINGVDLNYLLQGTAQEFSSSAQLKFIQDDFFSFYVDDIYLTSASRLPVDMSEFEVYKTGESRALVEWTTESEFNNDYFDIEVAREDHGITKFKSIGRVQGQGISTNKTNYQFVDSDPNKTGVRYYRIKQVDIDGTTAYTIIKQLLFRESVAKVAVYPNPVIQHFSLHYEAEQEEKTEVRLVNLAGKVLFQKTLLTLEGNHEYQFVLDKHLVAGMYMLQLTHANKRVTSIPISKVRD